MKITIKRGAAMGPDMDTTIEIEVPKEILDLARAIAKLIEAELGARQEINR